MNRIVILTGHSGSGKSTLARSLEESFGYERISTSSIIGERIRREHSLSLSAYILLHGITRTFSESRGEFMDMMLQKSKSSDLVVDGMYDKALFDGIKVAFRRESLLVVAVDATFAERMARLRHRGDGLARNIAREIPKLYIGIRKVMREADIVIPSGTSREEATYRVHTALSSVART